MKKYVTKALAVIVILSLATSGCVSDSSMSSNNPGESEKIELNSVTGLNDKKTEQDKLPTLSEMESSDEGNLVEEEFEEEWSQTQRNSINMLNYMSVLTQKINKSNGNQILLEELYFSLVNDMYPNAVDTKTQQQIMGLLDTIKNYQMIATKRERLQYIYEQNRAQALRQAIPNPIGLLSAVSSGGALKAAVSVLYMAADSVSSYKSATSQADLQYIQAGWELEDKEKEELHNSTKNQLEYMYNTVRDYDFDGDLALSQDCIQEFVDWSQKPESQLVIKTEWFKSHEKQYREFGPYWLELVKNYYNLQEYENCLKAINQYESLATRIYRKDSNKISVLPMVIVSAKESLPTHQYIKMARKYCLEICDNTKDEEWSLRYFVAQIYMDLFALTKDELYLEDAYKIARDNVIVLSNKQRVLNNTYMAELKEIKSKKDASKSQKNEVEKYNKLLKKERKIALPPVNEALYLNTDLLFALASEMNIPEKEKETIDSILHVNGKEIFLAKYLDQRFWFDEKHKNFDVDKIDISFDGEELVVPASCVTDRTDIQLIVSTKNNKKITIDDWKIKKVKRPKKSKKCSDFIATFTSEKAEKYKYKSGDKISLKIIPVANTPEQNVVFRYDVKSDKKFFVFDSVKLERVKND